jgi:flagellar basal-body rod modification protein FlgD
MTTPIAGSTAATTPTVSSSATSAAASTENQFLSILTTELTNQDPLNAMDASTFTSQLVSYAGLEQQIGTNSSLSGITTLLTSIEASLSTTSSGSTTAASTSTNSSGAAA